MSYILIALALLAFVLSFLFDLGRVRTPRMIYRTTPRMPGVYKRTYK